jgi:hypothetical protein
MKNLKVCLAILPLFTIACSDEYTGEMTKNAHVEQSAKKLVIGPGNSANPFDIAGSIHNEILETLDQTDFNSQSIEDIAVLIDSISAIHPELVSLSSDSALSSRLPEIIWIVNNNDVMNDLLGASTLGGNAKISLISFVDSLLLATDDSYGDIHSMIVSYEASILNNSELTSNDKRIMLTTTSVVRYSVYEDKRKDKDWETGISRIAATTVAGAENNLVLALKMALTVGLCQDNNLSQ